MEKYRLKIIEIGEYASEFISEGVLVFFGQSAPEELQEFAMVHDRVDPPIADIAAGDIIKFANLELKILAVGPVANENIKNLGHLVIKFNGMTEAEMDGDVTVAEVEIPEITKGLELVIIGE